ncbi:MAG: hypothetical protein MJE63_09020 [Proteobacteria bacterium]|nr:hypothetical protein [Pseudomonadota bacterium]
MEACLKAQPQKLYHMGIHGNPNYLIYLAGLSFLNPKRKNGDLFDPLMSVTLANPDFFIRSTVDQDKNHLRPRLKRLADSGQR